MFYLFHNDTVKKCICCLIVQDSLVLNRIWIHCCKFVNCKLFKKISLLNSDTIRKLFSFSNTGKEGVNLSFDFT